MTSEVESCALCSVSCGPADEVAEAVDFEPLVDGAKVSVALCEELLVTVGTEGLVCCDELPPDDVAVVEVVSEPIAVAVAIEVVDGESALERPFAVGVALGVALVALTR